VGKLGWEGTRCREVRGGMAAVTWSCEWLKGCQDPSVTWPAFAQCERKRKPATPVGMTYCETATGRSRDRLRESQEHSPESSRELCEMEKSCHRGWHRHYMDLVRDGAGDTENAGGLGHNCAG
jgi:hypothetical protein